MRFVEEKSVFKSMNEFSSDIAPQNRRRQGPHPSSFTCVNNAYCVTSFNAQHHAQGSSVTQTSLVIFDLEANEVVHRLTEANTSVPMKNLTLCVTQHPRYEKVCVTCDTEGQIIFWDCALGSVLRIFVEHAAHIRLPLETNPVNECNFSKCGNFLAIGTHYGSFSVYGYGGPDHFEHTDVEQFTTNDYIPISLMPDTYQIVSSNTGRLVDSDEEGLLCNFNMAPLQRLQARLSYPEARAWLDDKANALRSKILELRRVDENSEKDLCQVAAEEKKRAADQRRRLADRLAEASALSSPPRELPAVPEVSQLLPPVPLQNHEQLSASSRSAGPGVRRIFRKRLRSDSSASIAPESEEEDFDSEEETHKRRSMRLRRASRPSGGMSLRRRAGDQIGKRDIVENDDDDSEVFYKGMKKIKLADKAKETPVIEEEMFCTRCNLVGARERCQGNDGQCKNIFHLSCSDLCGADYRERFLCFDCLLDFYHAHPTTYEYSKKELDDSWLSMQVKDTDMMAPQIGDKCYFVFQAYEVFVTKFFDLLNFAKGDVYWPWRRFPQLQERETRCEVVAIDYEFPKLRGKKVQNELRDFLTIIMKITLRIADPKSEAMVEEDPQLFEVKYFPVNDMSSFLVWHQLFEKRERECRLAPVHSELKFGAEYFHIKEVGSAHPRSRPSSRPSRTRSTTPSKRVPSSTASRPAGANKTTPKARRSSVPGKLSSSTRRSGRASAQKSCRSSTSSRKNPSRATCCSASKTS